MAQACALFIYSGWLLCIRSGFFLNSFCISYGKSEDIRPPNPAQGRIPLRGDTGNADVTVDCGLGVWVCCVSLLTICCRNKRWCLMCLWISQIVGHALRFFTHHTIIYLLKLEHEIFFLYSIFFTSARLSKVQRVLDQRCVLCKKDIPVTFKLSW